MLFRSECQYILFLVSRARLSGRAAGLREQGASSPLASISFSPPSDRPGACVRDVVFVPDGVAGAKANPLGNGTVLLLRLGELLLRAESLVALFRDGG